MAVTRTDISDEQRAFIERQPVFFVATAPHAGRVNVSPKGADSVRVLSPTRVVYADFTGTGNETSAHVTENGRMTMMFCSFEEQPLILRLYGTARLIRPFHDGFGALMTLFPDTYGVRQFFELSVEGVGDSCGFGVPVATGGLAPRSDLAGFMRSMNDAALEEFRLEHNLSSIDGLETGYLSDDF